MSETDGPLNISISPSHNEVRNQSLRKDTLLKNKQIVRLGEKDPTYRDVLFLKDAFDSMVEHGMSNRTVEVAGILSGFHQGDQTIITRFIPSRLAEGTAGQVAFTDRVWGELIRENDKLNASSSVDDDFVAWFHTHPVDYPPEPITTGDQFIMRHYFAQSDKRAPKDMTTIIMTTYKNDPRPAVTAWKWDSQNNEAVWMKGLGVACPKNQTSVAATYFTPESDAAKRWGEPKEKIELTLPDIYGDKPVLEDDIRIISNKKDKTLRIELTDNKGENIHITLNDLDPDPAVLKISLEDLPLEQVDAINKRLRKNPKGPGSKLLNAIKKALKPQRLEDEITILPDD